MAENNYSLVPSSGKKVSNWDKPGGGLGLVVATALGAGLLYGLYQILPWLIELTKNVATLGALVVALGAIGYVLSSKAFRENVSMAYFILMRKIAGILIETDPIAIVERKIMEMREKIQLIREQMGKVKGLIVRNERRVEQKKHELEEQFLKKKALERTDSPGKALKVVNNQIDRLTGAIERAQSRLYESKKWYDILKKVQEYAELEVEDTENEVQDRKEEYEAIKAQHAAFSSIMSILKGDPNELINFTRAMDFMADDIASRLGEMSDVIDETGSLLKQIEVDDAITSERASQILRQYEEGGIESLFEKKREVKAIEGKHTDFELNFTNSEEREPVMVERNEDETAQEHRKWF